MDEIVKLIVDNGVSVGVLVYFMFINNTTIKSLTESVNNLSKLIQRLIDRSDKDDE